MSKLPGLRACAPPGKPLRSARNDTVILASGRLSNEDLFNLKQLADALGGKALLYDCLPGGELTTRYGVPPGTNLGDLGSGTTIVVAAADLYHAAPIWHLRIKQATERGATLVLVNSDATRLDKYARHLLPLHERAGSRQGRRAGQGTGRSHHGCREPACFLR